MKHLLATILFLSISTISFSQTLIAETEDGRKVLLKDNNTWEFVDSSNNGNSTCQAPAKPIKVSKNVKRLIAHVAVANECSREDVVVLSYTEGRGNGMYNVCVNGKIMKYRMAGTVFLEANTSPFPN